MGIKKYNPTTNARRNMSVLNYNAIVTTDKPEKSLLAPLKKRAVGTILVKSRFDIVVEETKENIGSLISNGIRTALSVGSLPSSTIRTARPS